MKDKKQKNILFPSYSLLLFSIFLIVISCDDETVTPGKRIIKFIFDPAQNSTLNIEVEGMISKNSITATVPGGTDITALIPTVSISQNASSTPLSGQAQDFTNPVKYLITATDSSTQEYTVNVNVAPFDEADIITLEVTIAGQDIIGTIESNTILLGDTLNSRTTEAMIKKIEISPHATASKKKGDILTFNNNTATIDIVAEDGITSQQYTVVLVDVATQIVSFQFSAENNVGKYTTLHEDEKTIRSFINHQEKSIDINISPYIYDFDGTSLIATFEVPPGATVHIGQTLQESGITPNNFTRTIVYRVTAADGSRFEDYIVALAKDHEAMIPDEKFREYIKSIIPFAFNGDNMDVTQNEVQRYSTMDVNSKGLDSLKGIEFFTGLKKLYCARNQLQTLDLSKNENLEVISCYGNQLRELTISPKAPLTTLWCYDNQLDTLALYSFTQLKTLSCYNNQLTSLTIPSNIHMEVLSCRNNLLTNLIMQTVPGVKTFIINAGENQGETQKNQLTQININIALKDHAEIREAKTNLEDNISIVVYDEQGNIYCPDYNPNTGNCD